jgi:hypothetical protein
MHPNEIDFRKLNEQEILVWEVLAADLGKGHVAALKEQRKRQAQA